MSDQHLQTVVIGGSQSGLAIGYHLSQPDLPSVILDENDRIGDALGAMSSIGSNFGGSVVTRRARRPVVT